MKLLGQVISLPSAEIRRKRISRHLHELDLPGTYNIVNACSGDNDYRSHGGLNAGEDGLWRSVLSILKANTEISKAHQFLHVLEDDAELSSRFCSWARELPNHFYEYDIIFTDMFVENTIFHALLGSYKQCAPREQIGRLRGSTYSGCTASWLIPSRSIPKVYSALNQEYYNNSNNGGRLPLDHALRRLIADKVLNACITFPFPTSICIEGQIDSSIQNNGNNAIMATNILNTILRRRLSYCDYRQDLRILGPVMEQLVGDSGMNALLDSILRNTDLTRRLRYHRDTRLLDMPNNPQAEPTS